MTVSELRSYYLVFVADLSSELATSVRENGAGDGDRTRNIQLGN